jgi:hypothetical protein
LSSVDVSKLIRLCSLGVSRVTRERGSGLTAHRIPLHIPGYLIPAYSVQLNPYFNEVYGAMSCSICIAEDEILRRSGDANRGG